MPNINRVIFAGHLGRDAEVREVGSTSVAKFSVASSRRWNDKNSGEKMEKTTWVDIEVWGKGAEIAGESGVKGASVLVEGSLELDEWGDRETGAKRSKVKIRAIFCHWLDKREGKADAVADSCGQNHSGEDLGDEPHEATEDIPF